MTDTSTMEEQRILTIQSTAHYIGNVNLKCLSCTRRHNALPTRRQMRPIRCQDVLDEPSTDRPRPACPEKKMYVRDDYAQDSVEHARGFHDLLTPLPRHVAVCLRSEGGLYSRPQQHSAVAATGGRDRAVAPPGRMALLLVARGGVAELALRVGVGLQALPLPGVGRTHLLQVQPSPWVVLSDPMWHRAHQHR